MSVPLTLQELLSRIADGYRPKFVHFWSHEATAHRLLEDVRQECLSQWYPSPFVVDDVRYSTAEHYMMAAKARLFGDSETEAAIVRTPHPAAAKKHGRVVRGFDEARWEQERFRIVVVGNLAKFSQHKSLQKFLLGTNDRVLVEASPSDTVWGYRSSRRPHGCDHPFPLARSQLAGLALMKVREDLR